MKTRSSPNSGSKGSATVRDATSISSKARPAAGPSGEGISPALEIILTKVPGLPPAMQVMPKLLRALGDTNTGIDRIADLVAFDPGLTVKLIQFCNSAALGGETRVSDVGQAINRLGVNCVFQLVSALTGTSVLKSPALRAVLDVDHLWEHSVTVALAASILAKDRHEDDSSAFTAGLLHESGKIVMAQAFREHYARVLANNLDSEDQLVAQEKAIFGFDHSEAGGRMLARGAFPEAIVASITCQHRPEAAKAHIKAAALLQVANALANRIKTPGGDSASTEPAHPEVLKILNITPESLPSYCERIQEEFKFANALCHL